MDGPVVLVVVAASAVGDAVAEDDEGACGSWDVGLNRADEVPGSE